MQVRASERQRRVQDPVEWGRRRQQSIKEAENLRAEGRFGHLTTEHTFRPVVPSCRGGDRLPGGLSPRPKVSRCSIVRSVRSDSERSEPLVWRQLPSDSGDPQGVGRCPENGAFYSKKLRISLASEV
eukprot:s4776_g1.t1